MERISRRLVVRGATATAGLALGTPSIHAQKGRHLRFAAHADLKILDPIWTSAYIMRNHGYAVYDTLFGTDENLQIKPQMVDRTTVSPVLYLRNGFPSAYFITMAHSRSWYPFAVATPFNSGKR